MERDPDAIFAALRELEFPPDARPTHSELKRRFKKLALRYHPDKVTAQSPSVGGGATTELVEQHSKTSTDRFQRINEAHALITKTLAFGWNLIGGLDGNAQTVNPYSRASKERADGSYGFQNYARSATVQTPSHGRHRADERDLPRTNSGRHRADERELPRTNSGRHRADERDLPRTSSSSNASKRTSYNSSGVPYPDDSSRSVSVGQRSPEAHSSRMPDHSFCREQAYLAYVNRRCQDDAETQHCPLGSSTGSDYSSSDNDWLASPSIPTSPVHAGSRASDRLQDPVGRPHGSMREEPRIARRDSDRLQDPVGRPHGSMREEPRIARCESGGAQYSRRGVDEERYYSHSNGKYAAGILPHSGRHTSDTFAHEETALSDDDFLEDEFEEEMLVEI